jgi:hypothetical protein
MTTLELRPHTPSWHLPVIAGHYERKPDGSIIARYPSRYALTLAVACVCSEARLPEIVAELRKLDSEARRTGRLRQESLELRGLMEWG